MRHTEAALDAAHRGRLAAPQAQLPLRRGGEDAQADEDVRLVCLQEILLDGPQEIHVGFASRPPES